MRVLIFGGREFANLTSYTKGSSDWMLQKQKHEAGLRFLDELAESWPKFEEDEYGNWLPDVTVISGGAKGADNLGEDWATINMTRLEVFKADWDTHGKKAGILRNQDMLDSGIDMAVQFPGGRGTADMRKRLDKAGVKVYEYR